MIVWSDFYYAALDAIEPTVFYFTSTWPPWWCHMHDLSSLLHQFWGKIEKPYLNLLHHEASHRMLTHVLTPSSSAYWFWRANRQSTAPWFWEPNQKTIGDFMGKIIKPQLPVLRFKLKNPLTLVLRLNQETCAPRLFVHGADHTQYHPTSWSFGHRVPDLCLTISGPLHQVFYSCLKPRRYPSCRTYHLHITRQANAFLHTKQVVG
jgi:hypothetical protein